MSIRTIFLFLICITLVSSQTNRQQQLTNNSIISKQDTDKTKKSVKPNLQEQKVAKGTIINPLKNFGSFMTLTPTGQKNTLNNPLYKLRLYADGKLVDSLITVSGRAYTQTRNRHQSGTEAPLPDGKYTVATSVIPGAIAEAGDYFIPIHPQFATRRTALGFHVDPSFEKNNGEDGTAGCIGLINKEDLDKLSSFIRTHKPKFLDVEIKVQLTEKASN